MKTPLRLAVCAALSFFILTGCTAKNDSAPAQQNSISEVPNAEDFANDPTQGKDVSEKDSKALATKYVLGLDEYVLAAGRDLKFISGDKTLCDSCYKFTFSFIADSKKPDFKTDTITVDVNVQGGEIVNYSTGSVGLEARPASELCMRVLTCEDGRTFPVERFSTEANECQRLVYLKNPCFSASAREVVADTPELKKCLGDVNNQLDTTAVGEYICVFPDQTFCSVDTYYSGACQAGKCKRECKKGAKGEGIYSSCTGNLIKPTTCGN